MNLTDDITLKCLLGSPVLLDDICAIYPATLRQIASIGYSTFNKYLQVLTMEKPVFKANEENEMTQTISGLTDYQYFLVMSQLSQEINQTAKAAFLFFTHENVLFSVEPAEIVVGKLEEKHIMNEEAFGRFRHYLRYMHWLNTDDDIQINPTDDERVRKMKEQLRRNRELVARSKAGNNEKQIEFSDLIASLPLGDCGLNILNIWDLTYYAFQDQLKRMGWHEQFEINNRAALAGAKINKKDLQHWLKSMSSEKH